MTLCNVIYRPAASSLDFSAVFSAESSLTALTNAHMIGSVSTVFAPLSLTLIHSGRTDSISCAITPVSPFPPGPPPTGLVQHAWYTQFKKSTFDCF